MTLLGKKIGFGITASFCTFDEIITVLEDLASTGAEIFPIVSEMAQQDSRFHNSGEFLKKVRNITGRKTICTAQEAEPLGPSNPLDLMIIAPATGNTIAKMAHGIWDTPVLLAAKATLRNLQPVLVAVSTNDALGAAGPNIMRLYNTKNVYFVPFGQDDAINKPTSMTAQLDLLTSAAREALAGRQLQPAIVVR